MFRGEILRGGESLFLLSVDQILDVFGSGEMSDELMGSRVHIANLVTLPTGEKYHLDGKSFLYLHVPYMNVLYSSK